MTEQEAAAEIEVWYKTEYQKLQGIHGKYGVPKDKSDELSEEYKRRHNVLIAQRKKEEKQHEAEEKYDRYCEVCEVKLQPRRGRPSKRCENCR